MLTVWSLNTDSVWVIWECTSKEQYIVREPDQSSLLSNKFTDATARMAAEELPRNSLVHRTIFCQEDFYCWYSPELF